MKKILIINPLGIGDVIFSTPLVVALKKEFPESYIGYVCNKRVSELISTSPDIDKVFVYEKDEYRDIWKDSKPKYLRKISNFLGMIRRERFDISIDLSLGYQYSMLLMLIGIKKRIGFNYRDRGRFLTNKVDITSFDDKHVIEHYLDMLKHLNVKANAYAVPKIYVSDIDSAWAEGVLKERGIADKDVVVGIICGCGASWGVDADRRRWDKKKFAVLADKLIDTYGIKVVFMGSRKESSLARDARSLMKNPSVDLSGMTTVGQMAALISRCRSVVTNDGGPLHVAVALGVNTVSIFGPVDERIYGPYPENAAKHRVVSRKDLGCRPCYKKFKYEKCEKRLCLDLITVDDVLKAAEAVLKK